MTNISLATLLDSINKEFFTRTILASLEVIKLLNSKHYILHESFGIGAGGDKSSGADLIAESIFCKFLSPLYHIDSEEQGFIEGDSKACETIVLDPLDGSSNFKSNIPYYGASLALCGDDGIVKEAFVINYVSLEISYLNDELLKFSHTPYVFSLNSVVSYISFRNLDAMESKNSIMPYMNDCISLIDFSSLLDNNSSTNVLYNSLIYDICYNIIETRKYLPCFNTTFLHNLFISNIIFYNPQQIHKTCILECGIFEKASKYYKLVEFLCKRNIKFRSLGAIALSLGFSFRYLFVLLPTSIRKYDGMAGFYLSQSQIICGNVSSYIKYIPVLQRHSMDIENIIVANDFNIINKFIGS